MNHPYPGFLIFLAYGCRDSMTQSNLDLFFAKPHLAEESIKWQEAIKNNPQSQHPPEYLKWRIEDFEKTQVKKLLLESPKQSPRLFTQVQENNAPVFEADDRLGLANT